MDDIMDLPDGLRERRTAAVFAMIIWLIFGLITHLWEDECGVCKRWSSAARAGV